MAPDCFMMDQLYAGKDTPDNMNLKFTVFSCQLSVKTRRDRIINIRFAHKIANTMKNTIARTVLSLLIAQTLFANKFSVLHLTVWVTVLPTEN